MCCIKKVYCIKKCLKIIALLIFIVQEKLKKRSSWITGLSMVLSADMLCVFNTFSPCSSIQKTILPPVSNAALSISPAPAPDLLDKPRQTSSLCKWLESLFKHWHQLETLYARLCVTRQGFPDATNTNIDSHKLIPQRLATSQKLQMLTLNSPFIIFSRDSLEVSPLRNFPSLLLPLPADCSVSSMPGRTFSFVVWFQTPPTPPPPPPPLHARHLPNGHTMRFILSTCCPLPAWVACVSSIFYTISTHALYITALGDPRLRLLPSSASHTCTHISIFLNDHTLLCVFFF